MFDSPRFPHQNLTCFRSGVNHFSAISLSGNRGCTFWCEYGISQCFFQDFTDCCVILFFLDCGLIIQGPTAARAD